MTRTTAISLAVGAVMVMGLTALMPLGVGAQRLAQLGQPAPEISGGEWINSPPLTMSALRGRVVFVEFWTYG